ncbi:MAG: hypothetical protein PHS97_01320 [Oscillospiraceae bacterium]|nr:hypothetical protein [Oscillospiraceae bacterium]
MIRLENIAERVMQPMRCKDTKAILFATNKMSLHRDCTHECIYCDARSTCYQILRPF